jgi:hypothetical protein
MTGGGRPAQLAAILELFRPVADEIVVAVDDRRLETAGPLAGVSDRLLAFPFLEPGDRPIPWLFERCRGRWILNVDDDEVPGPALLEALPQLAAREDLTHAWIARRWLFPDESTYLDEPPWGREYQLRLVLADPRFLGYSDEFHRPVVCHGPARFVDAPLWHLDTAVNDTDRRRAKALVYEHARRGMRAGAFSHNSGFYVPELRPGARTAPVPEADLAAIRHVLERGRAEPEPGEPPPVERASRAEVDAAWPGEPYAASLHRGRVELLETPASLVAGVQQTIDVAVENLGAAPWRWGHDAVPEIRLSYRWRTPDGGLLDEVGLRTALPCDLPPGERLVVPLHVLPPEQPGRYRLDVDLVHEHVSWFGAGAALEVEVVPRRRAAVAGGPDELAQTLDTLLWRPEVEPVLLRAGEPGDERFGTPQLEGLRRFLLGAPEEPLPRRTTVARTLRLLRRARLHPGEREPGRFLTDLDASTAVIVAGPDWEAHAPASRELWRLAATVAAARLAGRRVLRTTEIAPGAATLHDRALARLVARLAEPVPAGSLGEQLTGPASR